MDGSGSSTLVTHQDNGTIAAQHRHVAPPLRAAHMRRRAERSAASANLRKKTRRLNSTCRRTAPGRPARTNAPHATTARKILRSPARPSTTTCPSTKAGTMRQFSSACSKVSAGRSGRDGGGQDARLVGEEPAPVGEHHLQGGIRTQRLVSLAGVIRTVDHVRGRGGTDGVAVDVGAQLSEILNGPHDGSSYGATRPPQGLQERGSTGCPRTPCSGAPGLLYRSRRPW